MSRFSYKTESNISNNIANKLVASAKTQAEFENFLSVITSVDRDETLQIDFEKIVPMPECAPETLCDDEHRNALYYYLMTTGNEDMVDKLLPFQQFFSMDIYKDNTEKELSCYKVLGEKSLTSHNNVDPLIGTIGGLNGTHTTQTLIVIVVVV